MQFAKPEPSAGGLSYEANLARLVDVEKERQASAARRRERKAASPPTIRSGAATRPKPCIECGKMVEKGKRRKKLCQACYYRAYRRERKARDADL